VFGHLCWRIGLASLAALMAAVAADGQPAPATNVPAPAASSPEPIYWRQNLFLIPYQWSSATDPGSADAVWLYVSKDRGASWQKISEARPQVRAFNYHAEADGEYWFAIRTLDTHGRSWPEGPMQAELKVIVDTTIPRFGDLSGAIRDGNALDLHWQITDTNLDPATCKIEVQPDGAGTWQAVPTPSTAAPSGGSFEGKTTWQLPAICRTAGIRATVYDRAGNRAMFQATVSGQAVTTVPPNQMPTLISGRGEATTSVPASSANATKSDTQLSANSSSSGPFDSTTGWVSISAAPITSNSDQRVPVVQPWPATNRPAVSHLTAFDGGHSIAASDAETASQTRSTFTPLEPFRELSPGHGLLATTRTAIAPQDPAAATTQLTPPHSAAASSDANVGPGTRWVNSRSFALEYKLEDVGQQGVAKVELWGTRDNGRTWRSFAVDDDNRSPLPVTVDDEGIYGFRIVVEAAGGPGGFTPRPGDRPELWIGVDLRRPQVALTGTEIGRGDLAGRLILRWEASDDNLEPRPIGLFYSSRPTGPWSTIATSLANSGEYGWQVERHVPPRVYLRVEARDLAGNLAAFQTNEPVTIDLPQPVGLPGAVEPLGPTANVLSAGYR
jgi:hypothetical protein